MGALANLGPTLAASLDKALAFLGLGDLRVGTGAGGGYENAKLPLVNGREASDEPGSGRGKGSLKWVAKGTGPPRRFTACHM